MNRHRLTQNVSHPALKPKYGFVPNIEVILRGNWNQLAL